MCGCIDVWLHLVCVCVCVWLHLVCVAAFGVCVCVWLCVCVAVCYSDLSAVILIYVISSM